MLRYDAEAIIDLLFGRLGEPADVAALVLVLPAAALCWLESAFNPGGEGVFAFWTNVFAAAFTSSVARRMLPLASSTVQRLQNSPG